MEFTPENRKKVDEILKRYPTKRAALLPVLWLAQDQFGHLSHDVQAYVAGLLDVSPAHVYGVVTFYTMFHQKPVGRLHIQLCRTLSCALMGSENLLEHIKGKLGIGENETTRDGRFSLCTVECLASCGTGPAIMINEKYFENVTPKKFDEIVEKMRNEK